LIVDFDGVLARRNTELLLAESQALISRYRHIDPLVFESLFASLVAFPLQIAVSLFLKALGLEEVENHLLSVLDKVHDGIDDALPMIASCEERGLPLFVLSSGNPRSGKYDQIRKILGSENVLVDPTFSKLCPDHYRRIFKQCKINASTSWYVDDCPAALDSSKSADIGMTFMMTNKVFRRELAPKPGGTIDRIIDDWQGLIAELPQ